MTIIERAEYAAAKFWEANMILERYQIEELMWWARGISPIVNIRWRVKIRLEIGIEDQWVDERGPLHVKPAERVVARVYLAEPQCDHEVNVCECMPLAEKRIT